MRKLARLLGAGLWLSLACNAALADEASAPQQLLARMSRALRELDYQGSMVYQHDGRVDALRLFHAAGDPERERLSSLNGPPREVVRRGGEVVCFQRDGSTISLTSSGTRSLIPLAPNLASSSVIGTGYVPVAGPVDRVAGFSAQIVELRPRDEFRYGYRLWLDRKSDLLLRADLMGSNGQALEQVMFVNLEVGITPNEQDMAAPLGEMPTGSLESERNLQMPGERWRIRDLPVDFALIARTALPGDADGAAEHLLYGDGIANVSVYVERVASSGVNSVGFGARGALNVYTRTLGNYSVTVLGSVPAITVERLGRSLEAVPAAH
ncbi:MAG: MucB/RseB C-terminal domain-containing protein [Tahibacter sp.]